MPWVYPRNRYRSNGGVCGGVEVDSGRFLLGGFQIKATRAIGSELLVDEEMREAGDSRLVSGLASFLLILTNHTLYYRCKSNIRLARLCMSVHVSSSSSSSSPTPASRSHAQPPSRSYASYE